MHKLLLFIVFFSSTYANSLPYGVSTHEDQTFWIALFSLALIGIFALFFSSQQMKHINIKHDKMVKVQSEIQLKQQMILEFMGEKIELSTKGIVLHKEILRQNSFEKMTPEFFYEEMERFEKSEALLLDTTHELIDFLQIKSGHLEIKDESYKLSNILNEIYGFISNSIKKSKTELVYDIDSNVATELKGDSKRIEQVLRTLLTDILNDVKHSVVSLKVTLSSKENQKLNIKLHSKDKKITQEEIDSLFSNYTLREEYKTKEKLDLYIAYELVTKMGGSLTVESSKEEGTYYNIELPYQPQEESLIISKKSEGKNILIMEKEQDVAHLIANMIKQHEVNIEVYSSERLESQIPNFYNYDLVLINTMMFSRVILDKLEKVRSEKGCKIIEMKNIYESSKLLDVDKKLIDTTVIKPLQPEQIFNLLEKMFNIEEHLTPEIPSITSIKEIAEVSQKSFSKFSHVTLLIAEDNLMNQKILKGVLGDSGMKIIMVNNGKEALDEVKKNKELDLVFMDTNMPIMDGYESTKKIREIYNKKQLPIVAISSLGFQNDLDKIAVSGANIYLPKPFKIGELYNVFSMFETEEKSKIKNISHKLSKYEGNKKILDIQKGISYSNTAIFYKELLQEVLINLKDSNIVFEQWVVQHDENKIKAFIADTLRLAEQIGAISFSKILLEINHLFIYKNESQVQQYINLYTDDYIYLYEIEWKKLQKEIEEYLKC